ncbi:MAG: hypothetical protein Q7R54_03130 [bacterium]|nr:hypothetical protein [bacterium]
MRYITSPRFDRSYRKFSLEIQTAFEKQVQFLLNDIRHPSLRAKKYDEQRGVWQARVTDNVRFYFAIVGDVYRLLDIERHND